MMNTLKTTFFTALLPVLQVTLGGASGGRGGMGIALVMAAGAERVMRLQEMSRTHSF